MKRRCSNHLRFVCILSWAIGSVGLKCSAQTPPKLGMLYTNGYPVLTIAGDAGALYSIQYTPVMSPTNVWTGLTLLQLQASNNIWTDPTTPATGQRFYRAVSTPAPPNTNFVFIQPGSFQLGSPTNELDRSADESPQTIVTISKGFWIGAYPVTQADYQALMGSNPSYFNTNNGFSLNLTRPVEQVTWDDANTYCARLTQLELAAGQIPTNYVYRLPTEAEWEYACRAGTSTRFSFGDDLNYTNLASYAWYSGNSSGTTRSAGQKLPNSWKLYDMHGNVWEWCQDWYGAYPGGSAIDPLGPLTGSTRVIRGGGWDSNAWNCRSAARNYSYPMNGFFDIGFRVLMGPSRP